MLDRRGLLNPRAGMCFEQFDGLLTLITKIHVYSRRRPQKKQPDHADLIDYTALLPLLWCSTLDLAVGRALLVDA